MDMTCAVIALHPLLTDRLSPCVVVDDSHVFSIRQGFTVTRVGHSTKTPLR
jgi:hypothetical protein